MECLREIRLGLLQRTIQTFETELDFQMACEDPNHEILLLNWNQISRNLKSTRGKNQRLRARRWLSKKLRRVRHQVAAAAAAASACVLCALRQSREGCPLTPPGRGVVLAWVGCMCRCRAQSTTTAVVLFFSLTAIDRVLSSQQCSRKNVETGNSTCVNMLQR